MANLEKTDLGRLLVNSPNVSIFVSLLPSSNNTVIVKYSPEIVVSCVIPPQQFNIKYATTGNLAKKNHVKIRTPTLIMSCGYADFPENLFDFHGLEFTLWQLDTTKKTSIQVKPYLLANVYDKGKVCYGDLTPKSLRQAYNYYWASNFNDDIKYKHVCNHRDHSYPWHVGCKCDGSQKEHTCNCPRKIFHSHFGCGCTTVAKSIICRAKCSLDKKHQCTCCDAIISQLPSKFNSLNKSQIEQVAHPTGDKNYPGCGCSYRHKRYCKCGKNRCNCLCSCNCCNNKCNHTVCECSCCKNTCNCKCRCSPLEKLQYYLNTYQENLLSKQPWKDRTNFFCGESYWAMPRGSDAILVTGNTKLLKDVPKKYWRKDRDGRPLLIAAANKNKSEWVFESGSYTFTLDAKNVIFK